MSGRGRERERERERYAHRLVDNQTGEILLRLVRRLAQQIRESVRSDPRVALGHDADVVLNHTRVHVLRHTAAEHAATQQTDS